MKLLLVTVTIIAVFTADGRDFGDEPEEQVTTDEAQLFPGGIEGQGGTQQSLNRPDGHNPAEEEHNLLGGQEFQVSAEKDQQLVAGEIQDENYTNIDQQEEEGQIERILPRGSCKVKNTCVVLGGACITNATLCSGRLVAKGCKPRGSNCTCCVPATLETKLHNIEMELQSMKDNITDALLNQETKLDSLIEHQAEACYSPGFSCASGEGTCRPDSCNSTTEDQNGTCGGIGCKCCTTKICYSLGSSCASGQGSCRPNSCNSTTEDQSGTCGGASCKCCKTKPCYSPGSNCASGHGTCRVNSCLSTEYQNGTCGGASCKCCKSMCSSPGSSCASGHGTCRTISCNSNEYQYDTCGGTNCKCCKSCMVSQGEFLIGKQCFKMILSTKTWSSSRSYCQGLGLDLAQPEHPTLVDQYIKQKGWKGTRTWIGARGTGSCYRWLNGTCIPDTSSLWAWGPDGDKSSSWSVDIHNGAGYSGPLDAHASSTSFYSLCERK